MLLKSPSPKRFDPRFDAEGCDSLSSCPLNHHGPPEFSDGLWYLGKCCTGISVSTTKIMTEETYQKFLTGVFFLFP